MSSNDHILEPGQIEVPAAQIRFLIPAGQDLFATRADRFRQLAPGHPRGDYLVFLALLADAQQAALSQFSPAPLPDATEQALCREHGMPLLAARSWPRDPAWRGALTSILLQMRPDVLPDAAWATVTDLMQTDERELEQMADMILAGDLADVSPRVLPFVSAALQVYWVKMAAALGEDAFGKPEQGGVCPVCGSYPSTGIVRTAGSEKGLRYLSCSLCAAQWYMVRIKCSSCESTRGINHYVQEGSDGAVKAESCDVCNTYLKLLYLEKENRMDAMADDLATLGLDMLMDNEGKSRGGPNLFFHPGRG